MRVRVKEQVEGAKIERETGGDMVLSLRPGLVSAGAFAALVVALAPLPNECYEYLQRAV